MEPNPSDGTTYGAPTVGSTPVQLDPQGAYVVPGIEKPLTANEIKSGIMAQAKFTQEMQALAEQRRQVEQIQARSTDALTIMAALEEDFDSTVEQLRGLLKKEQPTNIPPTPSNSQQGQEQQVADPRVDELMRLLQDTRREFEQYKAQGQMGAELNSVLQYDPSLQRNPEMLRKVLGITAERNLPVSEAYKLATYDSLVQHARMKEEEVKAAELSRFIPSFGSGRNDQPAPPKDHDAALKEIFTRRLREAGMVS